jgi:hypothetical protein
LDNIAAGHKWTIINSSAVTGRGLEQGVEWVIEDGRERMYLFDALDTHTSKAAEAGSATVPVE